MADYPEHSFLQPVLVRLAYRDDDAAMRSKLGDLSDDAVLHELAGITGVGWTASSLGFIGSLVWYGNAPGPSQPLGSWVLLAVAIGCFVTTVGLDAFRSVISDADE